MNVREMTCKIRGEAKLTGVTRRLSRLLDSSAKQPRVDLPAGLPSHFAVKKG